MLRHACHPFRKAASFVAMTGVAVMFLFLLGTPHSLAQSTDALVQQIVQLRIEYQRLDAEKELGKISWEESSARRDEVNHKIGEIERSLESRSWEDRNRFKQQADALYEIKIAPLQRQWQAELQRQADARDAKLRREIDAHTAQEDQFEKDLRRDSAVAGQLQARRTRLSQKRERGEISETDFQVQDSAAEQKIVALANKYIAMGRGPRFTDAVSDQADRILHPPPPLEPRVRVPATIAPYQVVNKSEWDATGLVVFVLTLGGIALSILLIAYVINHLPKSTGPKPPPLTENFGSADFAPMESLPRYIGVTAMGVFLGKSSEPARRNAGLDGPGAPIVTTKENHTLIVARTRTGKGTRVIVPTLLRYAGNAFVIDPKGENAAITARTRRAAMNHTVHIINPWGVMSDLYKGYGFQPATYNPLDILFRNDPNAVATAKRLANAICPVTDPKNAFWEQNSGNILTAVFLWLTDQPGETKTLARAREIITLSRSAFRDQFLYKMAASSAFAGAIKEKVGNLIDLADNTYTGIFASLTQATDFISDPQLKKATNTSTFNIADLCSKPTTLYLVIPPDQIEAQKTWLRLLIASATQSFRRTGSAAKPYPCMMLIDEFPALGKLQELPTEIATMAGYGLDYTLVVQGIDQLKSVYGKDAGAILSNCAYKWYCNVTDLEGAKHLSESLGEATVRTMGRSFNAGNNPGGATTGESTNWGEKGRKLLTPDEIINLGRDVAIAFQPEGLPMYLRPIDYWNLPRAFAHLAADPQFQDLYWKPPLTYDANPYFAQSQPGQKPASASGGQSQAGPKQSPPGSGGPGKGNGSKPSGGPKPPPPGGGTGAGPRPNPGSGPKPPPGGSGSSSGSAKSEQSRTRDAGSKPPPGSGSSSGSAKSEQSKSENSGPKPPKQPERMGREEALNVFGLGPNATKDEIHAAYKRLMIKVHPDHEGSNWMAQKVNEAKAVLLGK